jgi:hypothetical protein
MMVPLTEQIGDAASLLGLLLALDTLFTSEQARRLDEELSREGGSRPSRQRSVLWTSAALGALTLSALLFLGPMILDVLDAVGSPQWEPILGVFCLAYVLLIGLLGWQLRLAQRAR